jgi:hypothetical protein
MHTTSPRIREDGHARRTGLFGVLVFAAILAKERVRVGKKELDRAVWRKGSLAANFTMQSDLPQ